MLENVRAKISKLKRDCLFGGMRGFERKCMHTGIRKSMRKCMRYMRSQHVFATCVRNMRSRHVCATCARYMNGCESLTNRRTSGGAFGHKLSKASGFKFARIIGLFILRVMGLSCHSWGRVAKASAKAMASARSKPCLGKEIP